jgi:hypothetical protein
VKALQTPSHSLALTTLWAILFVCVMAPTTPAATVGDRVELHATHRDGVPFHSAPGGSKTFQRVPDGTLATVTDTAREGRWLQLRLPDERSGWIASRYVARTVGGSSPPLPPTEAERRVWTSPEACQQVLASGARMVPANPAMLRVDTWNIRWFPRGCPLG